MRNFLLSVLFILSTQLVAAEPDLGQRLEEYFALPGLNCPTLAEVEDNPAVVWALENLQESNLGDSLLKLANSPNANERLIYLLLHRAFSVKEEQPKVYLGESWPQQKRLKEVDYLIVGSGPAGSVLAYELSRAGFHTLVIERGPLVRPQSVDTRALGFLKVGGGAVPTEDSFMLLRNGQTVGGGGTVNVDLAFAPTLPFVQRQLAKWKQPDFAPEKVAQAYSWVKEQIGTRTPSRDEINRNNKILLDGAKAKGLSPELYDLNTRPPATDVNLANDKLGPAERLLRRAILKGYPLQLLWDLEVKRILVEDGRAVGVEVLSHKTPHHPATVTAPFDGSGVIRAKNVILSAGTLGSATVLLRSKLGGDQVGKGILLHPSMPLIGHFDEPIKVLEGTASTIYATDDKHSYLLYECMTAGPDYASVMLFGTAQERARLVQRYDYLGGFGVLLIDEPHPENRIELDQKGNPKVYYEFRGVDRGRFSEGVRQGVDMMLAAGAKEVYLPTTEPLDGSLQWDGHTQPLTEPATVECVSGRTVITSAHMQGSCKMGHAPDDSVVDSDFRVWGFDNLYVCDTSIFPTSVGANPMQTAYTTAKLLADKLTSESDSK